MINLLKNAAALLLLWAGMLLFFTLALDAMEYEQTGQCRDCTILNTNNPTEENDDD